MTDRIVIDTIGQNAKNIPSSAPIVAGYDTGPSWLKWTATDWARFKGRKVHIDQEPGSRGTSPVSDVESGAKTIDDAIGDARIRRAKKLTTTIYVQASRVAQVKAAVAAAGLEDWVYYWVANWALSQAEAAALLGGKNVAIQFASPTSNPDTVLPGSRLTLKQADCDLSVCVATWYPAPQPKPKLPIKKPAAPHPKVTAATLGAAIAAAATTVLHSKGLSITPVEAKAITAAAAGVAGYWFPAKTKAGKA